MDSAIKFDAAEHLPLKDFLAHVMGLSHSLEPKFDEMHQILNKTEAMENQFARRLENLSSCLMNLSSRPCKNKSRRLTRAEKEILELADLYKSLYRDKERMINIRDQSSEMVNKEYLHLNPKADTLLTFRTPPKMHAGEEFQLGQTEKELREADQREISSWKPYEELPGTSEANLGGKPK